MKRYFLAVLSLMSVVAFASDETEFDRQARSMEPVRITKGFMFRYLLLPDGRVATYIEDDKQVKVHNTDNGEVELTLPTDWVTHDTMLSDGELLATFDESEMQLWNLQSGDLVRKVTDMYDNRVNQMRLSPDGSLVTFGTSHSVADPGFLNNSCTTLKRWNFKTGDLVNEEPDRDLVGFSNSCIAVLNKAEKSELAVLTKRQKIKIFDFREQGAVLEIDPTQNKTTIDVIKALHDGSLVVASPDAVAIYDTKTGAPKQCIKCENPGYRLSFQSGFAHYRISPTKDYAIGVEDEHAPSLRLCKIDRGAFNALSDRPKFLSNGDRITVSEDGLLKIWKKNRPDLCVLKELISNDPMCRYDMDVVAVLPDGKLFIKAPILSFYTTGSYLARKAERDRTEAQERQEALSDTVSAATVLAQLEQLALAEHDDVQGGCEKTD